MALGAPIASSNTTMFASSSSSHASSSSFRSFATSLADARHLDVAGRLANPSDADGLITSSGSGSSSIPTAISFAQVCLEQAERQQGAEVGDAAGAAVSSRAGPSSSSSWDENGAPGEESRQRWILEARTWELLHHLCADRYLHHPESDVEEGRQERGEESLDGPVAQGSSYYETPFSRVQDILDAKRGLRELKIIRDWLSSHLPAQHIAEVRKGYAPFSKNRLRAEKRTQVTSSKSTNNKSSSSSTIRALDPDAESRGQGRWDLDDSGYSKALHRTLFEYARSGQLAAAFDLARQADQPWRAASLRGAMLYYRQDLDSAEDDEDGMGMGLDGIKMVGGNRNRLLWKAVCRRLASSHAGTAMDPYERALYGSLAGHLQSVLAVSSKESWEEHLWAHVNAALEGRIEGALEGEGSSSVEGQDGVDGAAAAGGWWSQEAGGDGAVKVVELKGEAPTSSGSTSANSRGSSSAEDVRRELREIFDRLNSSTTSSSSQTIRSQSDDPYRVLQQALILDELPTLLAHVESRLPSMRASVEPKRYAHLVRFFAHVVLYLRLIDAPGLPGASCNGILRYYVEVLEFVAQEDGPSLTDENPSSRPPGTTGSGSGGDLVAMYASSLDPESAEASYAHYLKSLNETASLDEKRQALLRAREHHLDVAAVARLVVAEVFDERWPGLEAAGTDGRGGAGAEGLLALPSATAGDARVTPNEARLIASLDWLILLPKTRRYDAVLQSNALMRALLCRGRVQAARELLLRLPEDLLAAGQEGGDDEEEENEEQDDMADDQQSRHRGPPHLPQNARTEHLHYVAFFSCLSSQWTLLEVLSRQQSHQAHLQQRGHVGPSSMELHTWRTAVRGSVERLWRDGVEDVLRGDWLKIEGEEEDEDEDGGEDGGDEDEEEQARRQVELAAIRQLYIPEIVVRLHFLVLDAYRALNASAPTTEGQARAAVLGQAGPLLELVTTTLPVLVADERYKVYLEFVAAGSAANEAEGVGGSGSGSKRLKEYLGHVKDAHLLRLEVVQQGGAGVVRGVVGGEEWEVTGET